MTVDLQLFQKDDFKLIKRSVNNTTAREEP